MTWPDTNDSSGLDNASVKSSAKSTYSHFLIFSTNLVGRGGIPSVSTTEALSDPPPLSTPEFMKDAMDKVMGPVTSPGGEWAPLGGILTLSQSLTLGGEKHSMTLTLYKYMYYSSSPWGVTY